MMQPQIEEKKAKKAIDLGARELALWLVQLALEVKVLDPVVLEVSRLTSYTDYVVILSGKSDRQVKAIVDHLRQRTGARNLYPLGVEGLPGARWVLLDYAQVVVHVFHAPTREYYDLEGLWSDAVRVEPDATGKDQKDAVNGHKDSNTRTG